MYAQVVHYLGLACEKCGRLLIPHNRTTTTQVVDENGRAVDLTGDDKPGSRSGRLVMCCNRCGTETAISPDGFYRRVSRQSNAPQIVNPCLLVLSSARDSARESPRARTRSGATLQSETLDVWREGCVEGFYEQTTSSIEFLNTPAADEEVADVILRLRLVTDTSGTSRAAIMVLERLSRERAAGRGECVCRLGKPPTA